MMMSHPFAAAFRFTLCIAVVAACFALISADRVQADEDVSFIGVVTADNVFVRSGPADSYYPIGHVNSGDLVKVVGERFGWARIHAVGPTFERDEFFGYIIYPKTQPGRFRLEEDGKIGRTLGRADLLAPNLNTDFNPNDSWKPLIRLEADQTVRVLKTTESANNIVQKVVLPSEAEVWVSARYIERAGEAQRAAWRRYMNPEETKEQAKAKEPKPEQRKKAEEKPSDLARTDAKKEAKPKEDREQESRPAALGREEQPAPEIEPLEAEEQARAEKRRQEEAAEEAVEEPADEPDEAVDDAIVDDEPDAATDNEVAEVEQPVEEPTTAERLAEATLDDLEAAFEQLREEPIETAEVGPLLRMYRELAERADSERDQRFAAQRVEQLQLWAEIQQGRQRLARLRSRAELTGERAQAARRAVDDAGDYTAVGRLSVSTIYDGQRLPRLLRLQEPGTGRTVAYVQPDIDYDLTGMIGQLIGVIGDTEYDGGLRLNLIRPRRVDILAPRE